MSTAVAPEPRVARTEPASVDLRVAYLVNQYPLVSHAFIRREIAAMEAAGVLVERFTIRSTDRDQLVDPADHEEFARTESLLSAGAWTLFSGALLTAISTPARFTRAIQIAWRAGRRSRRGVLRHLAYLIEACRLKVRLDQAGVRHLHAHFGTNPAMVAWLCRVLGGPPFSFTMHGSNEVDGARELSLPQKAMAAEFVIAVSEFGRSQLCRWSEPEVWSRIHVIRCGLDAEFLDREPTDVPDNPRLICVGRLCREKAQWVLVDAAARLRERGVSFDLEFVGDGPLRSSLERRVDDLGLRDSVRFSGSVSSREVRLRIGRARALVLPSFIEGLPVVIMEAMAVGRPVVSTFVGGIPELVTPDLGGTLVPAGSVPALADALEQVLGHSSEDLSTCGRRAAARIRSDHDSTDRAADLIRLIARSSG